MNFEGSGRRDTVWFVIALLVPAMFFGARYAQVEHQMDQIAQAQAERKLLAQGVPAHPAVRLASAERQAR